MIRTSTLEFTTLVTSAILLLLVLVALAGPARAAMEPEEIMVRLATGMTTHPEPPRRPSRKSRSRRHATR